MSDDIAKRLRSWVKNETQENDPAAVITEAANEIERLREELARRVAPPVHQPDVRS